MGDAITLMAVPLDFIQKVSFPMNYRMGCSRRKLLGVGAMAGGVLAGWPLAAMGASDPRRSFTPGAVWRDSAGKPIQAHGGSIIQIGNTFYWYGENKEFSKANGRIWTYGVRCYASKDLYNWSDLGLIITPTPDAPNSPLHPENAKLDRPHILFNQRTRKFVCWVKIMENDGRQTRTVLTADRITGPYTIVSSGEMPLGFNGGDFDLVISAADGKAYQYFERVHSEMICADLSDDYTRLSGYYSTHFPTHAPGLVREGPACFQRNGKHYLITSGTTGYHPNPSQVAMAESFHGPFTVLGNLHPLDRSKTSFNSQISSVFKHPTKKDLYIALADRWNVDLGRIAGGRLETGEAYRTIIAAMTKIEQGGPVRSEADARARLSPEEWAYMQATFLTGVDTSRASYVWLPIRFDGDRPFIDWREEWSLDEFE